jgi:hypothetical protein
MSVATITYVGLASGMIFDAAPPRPCVVLLSPGAAYVFDWVAGEPRLNTTASPVGSPSSWRHHLRSI